MNSLILEEAALEYANNLEPLLTDRGELIESNVAERRLARYALLGAAYPSECERLRRSTEECTRSEAFMRFQQFGKKEGRKSRLRD